jgi:CRP/FNR family transcriptional regulator
MEKLLLLSHINLLDELPMDELQEIADISEMKPVKKGTLIFSPLKPISALFMLKKGQVRLYRMNKEGKQFTLDILVDGNIFGQTPSLSLTDDQVYAEAMVDTYLCVIGKDEFDAMIKQKPHMAMKVINILSTRLKDIYEISEKIAIDDVRKRILFLLLKLSERSGKRKNEWQSINMRLTHLDIATMAGTTRETVSTLMGQLKKEGLIKKGIFSALSINAEKVNEYI